MYSEKRQKINLLFQLENEIRAEFPDIEFCPTIEYKIDNATTRFGLCRKIDADYAIISISKYLFRDERKLKNTLLHEMLHTVAGTNGHKGRWKILADRINKTTNYNIKRTSSFNTEYEKIIDSKVKYILRCTECKAEYKYQKETKAVKYYDRYHCGRCKNKLERIVLN